MLNKYQPKTHYEFTVDYFNSLDPDINTVDYIINLLYPGCGDNPSWETFYYTFEKLNPLGATTPQMKLTQMNILYHIYNMRVNHDRIFYITPQMASNLARTDLNIDSQFLKSPFPEIFIQLDPGLFYVSSEEGTFSVSGFYVNFRDSEHLKKIRIMAVAILPEDARIRFNDITFYFKFEIGTGKLYDLVDEQIQTKIIEQVDELKKFGGLSNVHHIKEFSTFVFNVLLYITSKDPDVIKMMPPNLQELAANKKSSGKIKKLLKRASKTASMPYIVVGSKIAYNDQEEKEIIEAGGISKWKLEKRVLVSGHWRAQWYGSEKNNTREQRLMWIQPYTKGPEVSDVVHKKYKIGH